MKSSTICCGLITLFSAFNVHAQDLIGQSRKLINPYSLQEFSQTKNEKKASNDGGGIKSIPANSKFTIVDRVTLAGSEFFVIYFWNWSKKNSKYELLNYDSTSNEQRYFLIPVVSLNNLSYKLYRKFSPAYGVMTLPFKYRPQSGKFEKTFALSATGGVKFDPGQRNEHSFSLLLGVGPSTVTVDRFNTDSSANIQDPSDRAAVTVSLNFLYQWKHVQIGVSAGIDNLMENELIKYKYQGKGWFSLGIGISLFSNNEVTNPGSN